MNNIEVGDIVQLLNWEGKLMPDIGIVVKKSTSVNDTWLVEWTNSDPDHDVWVRGDMYEAWLDAEDLQPITKK